MAEFRCYQGSEGAQWGPIAASPIAQIANGLAGLHTGVSIRGGEDNLAAMPRREESTYEFGVRAVSRDCKLALVVDHPLEIALLGVAALAGMLFAADQNSRTPTAKPTTALSVKSAILMIVDSPSACAIALPPVWVSGERTPRIASPSSPADR